MHIRPEEVQGEKRALNWAQKGDLGYAAEDTRHMIKYGEHGGRSTRNGRNVSEHVAKRKYIRVAKFQLNCVGTGEPLKMFERGANRRNKVFSR